MEIKSNYMIHQKWI